MKTQIMVICIPVIRRDGKTMHTGTAFNSSARNLLATVSLAAAIAFSPFNAAAQKLKSGVTGPRDVVGAVIDKEGLKPFMKYDETIGFDGTRGVYQERYIALTDDLKYGYVTDGNKTLGESDKMTVSRVIKNVKLYDATQAHTFKDLPKRPHNLALAQKEADELGKQGIKEIMTREEWIEGAMKTAGSAPVLSGEIWDNDGKLWGYIDILLARQTLVDVSNRKELKDKYIVEVYESTKNGACYRLDGRFPSINPYFTKILPGGEVASVRAKTDAANLAANAPN